MNNLVYMNDNIKRLDHICLKYIEEELETFMKACRKAAYVFSAMVANDLSNYSKETFEEMVVSPDEIREVITRINDKISRELRFDGTISERVSTADFTDFDLTMAELDRQVDRNRMTSKITKISENVITGSVSLILGDTLSSGVLDCILSTTKIGEKLLSGNNHVSQGERFKKEIYRHIDGVLTNISVKLRNELMLKWAQYENDNNVSIYTAI